MRHAPCARRRRCLPKDGSTPSPARSSVDRLPTGGGCPWLLRPACELAKLGGGAGHPQSFLDRRRHYSHFAFGGKWRSGTRPRHHNQSASGPLSPVPFRPLPGGKAARNPGAGSQGGRPAFYKGSAAPADCRRESAQSRHHHAAVLSHRWSGARGSPIPRQADLDGRTDRGCGGLARNASGVVGAMAGKRIDQPRRKRRQVATRRDALRSAGAIAAGVAFPTLWLRRAAATPADMRAPIAKVVGDAKLNVVRVKLEIPPLVENGNTVPCTVSVDSSMTPEAYVKAIHVFNEKNPQPNVISARLSPRAGRASIATRIRLTDTQTVVAIAEMSDGSFWSDSISVIITLGACLENLI